MLQLRPDRYIARQVYLKKIEKNLQILADIEKEKPILFALTEMNISERSEVEVRKCMDFNTYSAAKDPLPFIIDIIQTHQLAPTGDHLVDSVVAMQAYHIMKQQPGEPANRYRIRMENKIKVMERLGLDVPT